ncbi:MAG TPA: hypothetical protein VIM11_06020 [Tepidisphaeraceae bacterium]|jgi:hypothetical protein
MTEYSIQIRTTPDSRIPDAIGLRKVLKVLLRTYGLRCVSIAETPTNPSASAHDAQDKPEGGMAGIVASIRCRCHEDDRQGYAGHGVDERDGECDTMKIMVGLGSSAGACLHAGFGLAEVGYRWNANSDLTPPG